MTIINNLNDFSLPFSLSFSFFLSLSLSFSLRKKIVAVYVAKNLIVQERENITRLNLRFQMFGLLRSFIFKQTHMKERRRRDMMRKERSIHMMIPCSKIIMEKMRIYHLLFLRCILHVDLLLLLEFVSFLSSHPLPLIVK